VFDEPPVRSGRPGNFEVPLQLRCEGYNRVQLVFQKVLYLGDYGKIPKV